MARSRRRSRLAVATGAALLCALPAAPTAFADGHEAGAEEAKAATEEAEAPAATTLAWDQERVTELATELATAVAGVRESFRREPPPTLASGESRARMGLLDLLRRLQSESRHLAKELAKGEGHEETLPVYEHLIQILHETQEEGRRIFLQGRTLERIRLARAILEKLDPYYDQRYPLGPRVLAK